MFLKIKILKLFGTSFGIFGIFLGTFGPRNCNFWDLPSEIRENEILKAFGVNFAILGQKKVLLDNLDNFLGFWHENRDFGHV